jgi:hypothetical protein
MLSYPVKYIPSNKLTLALAVMYEAILTRLPVKSRLSLLPNDNLYISESIY